MSEKSDSFLKGCKEIQKNCCCHSWDERDCYRSRYPAPIADCFSDESDFTDDCGCECGCHAEIGYLELEIFGEEEY